MSHSEKRLKKKSERILRLIPYLDFLYKKNRPMSIIIPPKKVVDKPPLETKYRKKTEKQKNEEDDIFRELDELTSEKPQIARKGRFLYEPEGQEEEEGKHISRTVEDLLESSESIIEDYEQIRRIPESEQFFTPPSPSERRVEYAQGRQFPESEQYFTPPSPSERKVEYGRSKLRVSPTSEQHFEPPTPTPTKKGNLRKLKKGKRGDGIDKRALITILTQSLKNKKQKEIILGTPLEVRSDIKHEIEHIYEDNKDIEEFLKISKLSSDIILAANKTVEYYIEKINNKKDILRYDYNVFDSNNIDYGFNDLKIRSNMLFENLDEILKDKLINIEGITKLKPEYNILDIVNKFDIYNKSYILLVTICFKYLIALNNYFNIEPKTQNEKNYKNMLYTQYNYFGKELKKEIAELKENINVISTVIDILIKQIKIIEEYEQNIEKNYEHSLISLITKYNITLHESLQSEYKNVLEYLRSGKFDINNIDDFFNIIIPKDSYLIFLKYNRQRKRDEGIQYTPDLLELLNNENNFKFMLINLLIDKNLYKKNINYFLSPSEQRIGGNIFYNNVYRPSGIRYNNPHIISYRYA